MRRFLRAVLAAALLLAVGSGATGAYLVRRAFPQVQGTLVVAGLQQAVEVIRDPWGVPHVYARTEHDLFFAQGYVHAQDRLWQMELNRRTATGRLSELFGERTLRTDRFLRTLGLRQAAALEWGLLSEDTRAALRAYAAGVNAFLQQNRHRLPLEFVLLRTAPEPWTPLDSLSFGKLMAYELGGNWQTELLRAELLRRLGPEAVARLLPGELPDSPVIVPEAGSGQHRAPAAGAGALSGSNNWVLRGQLTDTGRPYLANDPHLRAGLPSTWYTVHLEGGRYRVAGFSFPGVPGVVIGHNEWIAWGVTNANPDVQDLFVERLHPRDPSRYLFRGRWHPVQVRREEIRIRGRAPEQWVVRSTHHGPVLNGVVEGLRDVVALRWTALVPTTVAEGVLRINRARNWREFREALRYFHVPSQNFVYADREGNIGYQLPGRIPVRAKGDGTVPVPGWTGEYEWVGWVPYEALPSAFNPPRGWIATANNRIVPAGFRYLLGSEWSEGLRAQRIAQVLTARGRHTLEDLQRLQFDHVSLAGRRVAPVLSRVEAPDETVRAVQEDLRRWDGTLSVDSRAGAVYEAFLVQAAEYLFRSRLGDGLWERYASRPFVMAAFLRLWERPSDPWWGPGGRDRAASEILRRAVRYLEARLGRDRSRWTWGALHQVHFAHALLPVPVLGRWLSAGPVPTPGDGWTVNQAAYSLLQPFRQTVVASMRMVLDVGEWDRSVAVHTTGQSGLPGHPHRADLLPLWASGRYHPLLWSRAAVEQQARSRLLLRPAGRVP
ncbi:MAG: penicillin acylase family protein [Armatimonadota bacterium]|nr:penicillin acylase family protein [Armatimonadota bacterium]MDR7391696.1 penicillin acylase family protein [Armatimonadota bacterium]MDR7397219.1 penicillin acylase family protein [Armatimonadota bacterium]MDR7398412.1 penicillin acylase family protein [Armatimonadota bacterium]MDR7407295.1 penicillin acylase family protein [Armatimonadota bacterium]